MTDDSRGLKLLLIPFEKKKDYFYINHFLSLHLLNPALPPFTLTALPMLLLFFFLMLDEFGVCPTCNKHLVQIRK